MDNDDDGDVNDNVYEKEGMNRSEEELGKDAIVTKRYLNETLNCATPTKEMEVQ